MSIILCAMSGGVDSAVAACLLKEGGHEVVGITMRLWPKSLCGKGKERPRACCTMEGIEQARRVAFEHGFPHYVLDLEEVFQKEVIQYFCQEYRRGRTPNPCIACNKTIKFGALFKKAGSLNCDYIATGHYARLEKTDGKIALREAVDKHKDQSYPLFNLTQPELGRIILPLGELEKSEVRLKAKELNLPMQDKPDSQEICFINEKTQSQFIKDYLKIPDKKGNIIDTRGKVVGRHNGIFKYTIGQREGLGIALGEPRYVIKIDPEKNEIIVGSRPEASRESFSVGAVSWISGSAPGENFPALVKIRSRHPKSPAQVKLTGAKTAAVSFEEPQFAVTPGQAAVFYDGEYVLGGGWID